jgi:hypothetical protein
VDNSLPSLGFYTKTSVEKFQVNMVSGSLRTRRKPGIASGFRDWG